MQAFDFIPSKLNCAAYDIRPTNENPTLVVQWGHLNSSVRDNLISPQTTNWYLSEIGLSPSPSL